EEKSDAGLVNAIGHLLRRAGNRDSKIFEHIGGTCLGSDRLIPMLQHHPTGRSEQEYTGRRDIDQFKTVAASPNNIDGWLVSQPKDRPDREFQKGPGEIPEFLAGLSLYFQSHKEIAFVELGNAGSRKLPGCLARLIHPRINLVAQFFD